MTQSLSSIFDSPPLESGGVDSRRGSKFQDHVAARFCLEMLDSTDIIEVWHEFHDDVTLVRSQAGISSVEYIQVKNTDEQYWSITALTSRRSKKNAVTGKREEIVGDSILEKNLANDIRVEKAYFRLVTSKDVGKDLKILTYDFDAPARQSSSDKMISLLRTLEAKNGDYKTPGKGSSIEYWTYHIKWEVFTNSELLSSHNKVSLLKFAERNNFNLKSIECDAVYKYICDRMSEAGATKADIKPDNKKFKRNAFETELIEVIRSSIIPTSLYTNINDFDISLDYLKDIIVDLYEVLNNDDKDDLDTDFTLINMDDKNRINGMTPAFFKTIMSTHSKYFDKIFIFLSKPINLSINDKYQDLSHEINMLLAEYKGTVANFDQFILQICRRLTINSNVDVDRRKRYVWMLISYMYYKCDIGDKE